MIRNKKNEVNTKFCDFLLRKGASLTYLNFVFYIIFRFKSNYGTMNVFVYGEELK